MTKLADIRQEYSAKPLLEAEMHPSPLQQFQLWLDVYISLNPPEPTAMTVATVTEDNAPDIRVVLLKGIYDDGFVFYTNYQSAKGKEIENNPNVALNFYWPELFRQVRVKGLAKRLPTHLSDAYFTSRPYASQCSAIISPQSQIIISKDVLQHQLDEMIKTHQTLQRPDYWGGYVVYPISIEFWQGQKGRFHDRLQYLKEDDDWQIVRLAP
jgi:pyridoxamine 5'-phosphate oxidase